MSDADRARAWDAIDANLESAWRFATRLDAVGKPPWSYRDDALLSIAHALIAIAQMARIAMAERYERSGKAP